MRRPSGASERKPGLAVDDRRVQRDAPLVGDLVEGRERRATCWAPTIGFGIERALPPPSPTSTASGASIATSAVEVALARRAQEAVGERVALRRVGVEARQVLLDAPARAAESLAAGVG